MTISKDDLELYESKSAGFMKDGVLDEKELVKLAQSDPNFARIALQVHDEGLPAPKPDVPTDDPLKPTETPVADTKPVVNPAPSNDDEELTINVKMKKSELGTYAKNRDPADAIREMAKGNRQKDTMIDSLKKYRDENPQLAEQVNALSSERAELQRQITELSKVAAKPQGQAATQVAADGKAPITLPEIPAMPEAPKPLKDDESFDVDKTNKYYKELSEYTMALGERTKALEIYARATSDLRTSLAAKEEEIAAIKGEVAQTKEMSTQIYNKTTRENAEVSELQALENLRARNADIMGEGRGISEIEHDYIEFMKDVATHIGINDGIYVKKGNQLTNTLRPEIVRAVGLYENQDSPDGQKLREALESKGSRLPEDIGTLAKIYEVRTIQKNNFTRDQATGKIIPISLEEALDLAKSKKADMFTAPKSKRDQKVEEAEARARAEANLNKGPTEADPSKSGAGFDFNKLGPKGVEMKLKSILGVLHKNPQDLTENDKEFLKQLAAANNQTPQDFGWNIPA